MSRLLVLMIAFCCLLAASPGLAGDVRAILRDGVGQLVIDWPEPVAITTEREGEALAIAASRPFPAGITGTATALAPLLAASSLDDDRTTLRLHPAAMAAIDTALSSPGTLTITLRREGQPGPRLRFGQHADHRRVVIEPVARESVMITRLPDRLALNLPGPPVPGDLARLEAVPGIAGVEWTGQKLELALWSGTRVREHFVAPDKQVLDVYPGAGEVRAPASAQPPAARTADGLAAITPRPRPAPPRARQGGEGIAAAALPAPAPAIALGESPDGPEPADIPALAEPARLQLSAAPIGEDGIGEDGIELRFAWPRPVAAAAFVRGRQLWVAFAHQADAIDVDERAFAEVARRHVSSVRQEPHPTATFLRFDLARDAGLAVRREGGEWRVELRAAMEPSSLVGASLMAGSPLEPADGPAPVDGPALLGGKVTLAGIDSVTRFADPIVGDRLGIAFALEAGGARPEAARFVGLRFLPTAQGAAWRMLGEGDGPALAADGTLVFGPADGVALDERREESVGTRSLGPVEDAPVLVTASVDAAPEAEPDQEPQETPATEPVAAPPLPLAPAATISDASGWQERQPGPLLDLARFTGLAGGAFWDHKSALLQQAGNAGGDERARLLLDLARLHVAHGLGAEALAVLATLPPPPPGPAEAGARRRDEHDALKGAALLLAGRGGEAMSALRLPALQADDEVALWRGAAGASLEEWDSALADWWRGAGFLAFYSPPVQAALGELGAMLLLQNGLIDDSFAQLEWLLALRLDPAAAARVRLIEATALWRDGAMDEARGLWRRLIGQAPIEARSQAVMALAEADLEAGLISHDDAIARLLADSAHWRGQTREMPLRRRLAGLLLDAGRPEEALTTLRQALTREPPPTMAAMITKDMAAILDAALDAFDTGRLEATTTLALYRRFPELLEAGGDGDARIERLGMALARLGLQAQAIDIMRERLRRGGARDASRARLGLTLGRLLAEAGERREALAALMETTPLADPDPDLALARHQLLGELGDGGENVEDDGLAAIDSSAGNAPRAAFARESWSDVLTRGRSWEEALPSTGRLGATDSELVLMLATAARHLGEEATVQRLAARHAARLATEADAALLRLLANPPSFAGGAADILAQAGEYLASSGGLFR